MRVLTKFCLLLFPLVLASNLESKATTGPLLSRNRVQVSDEKVTGVVLDKTGLPVIGATVIVKGTTRAAITDLDGRFSITASKGSTIQITFIGLLPETIKIGNKKHYKVVLKEDSEMLEEVVVVGYGTQKKKSVVGAIAQTSSKELMRSGGVTSVGEALQGKLPGVSAVYSSGRPGEKTAQYYIRGQSSWNGGGQPLVMIDGVEGDMSDIDINEVENVSVLKDASATAVYGVKGANGVILLTTKRGKKGESNISLSANMTLKSISKVPSQYDSYDAIGIANGSILNELAYNPGAWGDYVPSEIRDRYRNQTTLDQRERYPNVNWEDYLFKDVATDYRINLSARGGNSLVKYFCNTSYLHESDLFNSFGNVKGYDGGFDYHRFNYRSNLDFDITKTTKLAVNISGSYSTNKRPNGKEEMFMYNGLYRLGPATYYPIYSDGAYGMDENGSFELRNPVADLVDAGTITQNKLSLVTDFAVNQDLGFITKGLTFKGHFMLDNVIQSNKELYDGGSTASQYVSKVYVNDGKDVIIKYPTDYTSDFVYTPNPWYLKDYTLNDWGRARRSVYDLSLNYSRTFGDHDVSALALFKREQYAYGSMIPTYREDWVGRLTYNYKYTYFIEANGAYNGSEKFGPGYRFDLFPSVALGWMVTEEAFMKKVPWINKLKLRASYGVVGDDNFSGRWKYMTQWGTYNSKLMMNKFSYDGSRNSAYTLYKEASVGNPDLHWEKAIKQNYGFDLGVLDNQLRLTFDYFTEDRSDIMIPGSNRAIPSWFGIDAPDANLGEVEVRGYEFVLNGNKRVGNVDLRGTFTYSHAKDKIIVKSDPALAPYYTKQAGYAIGQNRSMIGGKMITNWDDVYMSTSLADGQDSKRIGYYDLIDFNNDGNVNSSYDTVPYGYSSHPQNTWSLNLGMTYKAFSCSVQFYGQSNISRQVILDGHNNSQMLYFTDRGNIWSPSNPSGTDTYTPWSLTKAANNPYANWYDGSMIRLKMVELSYDLPSKVCKSFGVKKARVFMNGNNLALWTDLPDDREYNDASSDGYFRGAYPTVKRVNFGLNVDF